MNRCGVRKVARDVDVVDVARPDVQPGGTVGALDNIAVPVQVRRTLIGVQGSRHATVELIVHVITENAGVVLRFSYK